MSRNKYLDMFYWQEDGDFYRAYFENCDFAKNPRDFDEPLGKIVNASKYCINGRNDEFTDNPEEWLIYETGINQDWYESHNNYTQEDLLTKFKKQCLACFPISIYDHSGITVSIGYRYGWDCSNIGYIYVKKDNPEVVDYRKKHTLAETKEWAEKILEAEIKALDDWCVGNVYNIVKEKLDQEIGVWEYDESCCEIYFDENYKEFECVKDIYGNHEFITEKEFDRLYNNNLLDTVKGQRVFEFIEVV